MNRFIFLFTAILLSAVPYSADIGIPSNLLDEMGGEWAVELHSPCLTAPVTGNLTIGEEVKIVWGNGKDTVVVPGLDETLEISDLYQVATNENRQLYYRLCEQSENHIPTPSRPVFDKKMELTYLREFKGALSLSRKVKSCSVLDRSVVIRTLGSSSLSQETKAFRKKDAIQFMEIVLDAKVVPDSCAEKPIHTPSRGEKKGRRHRARQEERASSPADSQTESGFITVRMTRKSPLSQSIFERYYPIIVFITLFTASRVFSSLFSYSAEKS